MIVESVLMSTFPLLLVIPLVITWNLWTLAALAGPWPVSPEEKSFNSERLATLHGSPGYHWIVGGSCG